jgi:hypothetical protein
MMWAWAIGMFAVAAVVNQSAIALFRRAQADTEPGVHLSRPPNCNLTDDTGFDASPALNRRPRRSQVHD